jgi:hypothetical protein
MKNSSKTYNTKVVITTTQATIFYQHIPSNSKQENK